MPRRWHSPPQPFFLTFLSFAETEGGDTFVLLRRKVSLNLLVHIFSKRNFEKNAIRREMKIARVARNSNLISSVPRRRLGWIEKLRGEKREINSLGGQTRNNVLAALVTQFGGKWLSTVYDYSGRARGQRLASSRLCHVTRGVSTINPTSSWRLRNKERLAVRVNELVLYPT